MRQVVPYELHYPTHERNATLFEVFVLEIIVTGGGAATPSIHASPSLLNQFLHGRNNVRQLWSFGPVLIQHGLQQLCANVRRIPRIQRRFRGGKVAQNRQVRAIHNPDAVPLVEFAFKGRRAVENGVQRAPQTPDIDGSVVQSVVDPHPALKEFWWSVREGRVLSRFIHHRKHVAATANVLLQRSRRTKVHEHGLQGGCGGGSGLQQEGHFPV